MAWLTVRHPEDHPIGNHMTVKQNKNFALYCNAVLNNEKPDRSWFRNRPFEIGNNNKEFIYD